MNKKGIYLEIIVICLLITAVAIFTMATTGNNKVTLREKQIANKEETKIEIPDFELPLYGEYSGKITGKMLRNAKVKVYEFDAGINNGYEIKTNHYVGVLLTDVLKTAQINEYGGIEMSRDKRIYKFFSKEEISNNTYLIFYRDGELIRNSRISIISFDYDYRYSLEGIQSLFINKNGYVINGA